LATIRRQALKEAVLPFKREDVLAVSERTGDADWMREKRLAAWEAAEQLPMPTTNDEPWRRTDIRMVRWEDTALLTGEAQAALDMVPAELYHPLIGDEQGALLVFVNGRLVHREINPKLEKQGVIFMDLATAAREHPALVQKYFMTHAVLPEEGKFAAVHGALWTHGVFLYVPRGQHIELPLHSVEYVTGRETTATHILAVLDEDTSATFLHESTSRPADGQTLHLGAVELLAGTNANLRFVRIQNWAENMIAFEHQRGRVGQAGQIDWVVGEMGSRLSKLFTTLDLDQNDAWGRISGLYFTHGSQHLDIDTEQNHHALRNTSDLLYKGGLLGESRTVWQGMIVVDPGAQKTDGYQVNRNLILDRSARADSIPGLEIKADDVRCTHAAATGQLDQDEIFYLMSRGISRFEATKIIVRGFFDDVMQRIPFEEVVARLADHIEDKLNKDLPRE